jgi:ribose-phosphate pyrophosphokinase
VSVSFSVMTPQGLVQDAAEPFQYPGGEWDLRNTPVVEGTYVAMVKGADANDLVKAASFAELALQRNESFVLLLPYLPAARSDRPMDGRPVGANVYGRFVNSMYPDRVITIDAHSKAAQDNYGHRLRSLSPAPLVRRALEGQHLYHSVVAPDEGATDRAHEVARNLDLPVVQCVKHRDTATGKITGLEVPEIDPKSRYLVVDDICDGGRTFIELAQKLNLGPQQLGLWVTHGIFSGDAHRLRGWYSNIFTTNSHPGHNNLRVQATVVPVEPYLWGNM